MNGLEQCAAIDGEIAIRSNTEARENFLSMALSAQARNGELSAWVSGYCVSHNGKEASCVGTLTSD